MNPNFDFRDSAIWDDREVTSSVGDGMAELMRFLGLCLFMLVIAMGCGI